MKTADLGRIALALLALTIVVACGGDSGPPVQPTLRYILLTPTSVSLPIGGTRQFGVSGQMSDGSTVPVSATYTATGGTITSDGLYTAGSVKGTYWVVASVSAGMLADTSDVTLTEAGAHNSYTTGFPLTEDPISEGGHWINGGTVGLDWANVSTTPGRAIGHQIGTEYTDATAILTGQWAADQRVEAVVFSDLIDGNGAPEVELRLRSVVSARVNRGYEVMFSVMQGSKGYVAVARWNGAFGDFAALGFLKGSQYNVVTGDVIAATIIGSTITVYKNGAQIHQVTDLTWTDGNPGMGFNLTIAGAGHNADYGFSRWSAEDLPVIAPPAAAAIPLPTKARARLP